MKELTLDTNFNSKADCDVIVHITFAPKNPVSEVAREEPIRISFKDGSHPPVTVKLIDLRRCTLDDLTYLECYASYGLTSLEFKNWWLLKFANCSLVEEMAVYVYRKMKIEDASTELSMTEAIGQKELNLVS